MKDTLVFSDIDGTILNTTHQLTIELIDWMKNEKPNQVHFVLASARPPIAMFEIHQQLGLDTPIASFNSALIINPNTNEIIHSQGFSVKKAQEIYQAAQDFSAEISVNVFSGTRWLVDKIDYWVQQEMDITNVKASVMNITDFLQSVDEVHKILCMANKEILDNFTIYLANLGFTGLSLTRSKPTYLEIVNEQVSKHKGLFILQDYYDIDHNQTYAIGDHFNDLAMIQAANIGIAMGNAPQDVKNNAQYITKSNDENGAYEALKHFFSIGDEYETY
ncbi:MAG: HAD family phosphatase [Clostridiaceae bacterium]|nr:HAD family phosphatase [Clostridiaceae bacterium]